MSDNLFFSPEEWARVYGNVQQPSPQPPPDRSVLYAQQPIAPTAAAPIQGTPMQVVPPPPRTQVRAIIDVQAFFENQYMPPYEEEAAKKIYEVLGTKEGESLGPWWPQINSLVTKIEIIGPQQLPPQSFPPERQEPPDKVSYQQFAEVVTSLRIELETLRLALSVLEAQRAADGTLTRSSQLSDLLGGDSGDGADRGGNGDGAARRVRTAVHRVRPTPAVQPEGHDAQAVGPLPGSGTPGSDSEGEESGDEPHPGKRGRGTFVASPKL